MMSNSARQSMRERFSGNSELLLQINVGVLVILGTSLLAMGQRNVLYALIAAVAAGTAIIITDIKGYFRLGPDATTLAALFACLILVIQVIRNVEQSQLLNVANILIYLQVILLFQEKQDRTYWSLMALSLLQVIVAAALNLGLMFGVLLGVYVMAAGSGLMLFFVVREMRPYSRDSSGTRWGGSAVAFHERSDFIGALDANAGAQIINGSLLRRLGRMIVFTVLATVIVFFAIPRYGTSVWQGASQDQVTTIGFSDEVRLNDIGRILENNEQVMRVEFTDLLGRFYQVDTDPYFRGTVLTDYRGDGVWKQQISVGEVRPIETQSPFDLASTLLQRITLQPGTRSVVFNVAPSYHVPDSRSEININLFTRQLSHNDEDHKQRGPLRYRLRTTAFRNGWQRDLIAAVCETAEIVFPSTHDESVQNDLRTQQPTLVQVADAIVANAGLQNESAFDRAKALESHFRRSGVYTYSLEVNQNRSKQLDPIEDFVKNHHTGHCEYFASALTLMLRSQGIPARMVIGYRGGEFNTVGNYYIVRQLHAHAWVEAFLTKDEIPLDERDSSEPFTYGCWLRLDPTPNVSDVAEASNQLAIVTKIREFVAYCQVLWDDYVLGLNSIRQQQAIYRPIMGSLRMIGKSLFDSKAWQSRFQEFKRFSALIVRHQTFGIPTLILMTPAVLLTLAGLYRNRRWMIVSIRSLLARVQRARVSPADNRPRLEIYCRMESAMARMGLVRRKSQTPFEFSGAVEQQLAMRPKCQEAAGVPRRITDAFYRFRFGNERLSDREAKRLLSDVQLLEDAIHADRHSRAR